jgi:hypothetical protein
MQDVRTLESALNKRLASAQKHKRAYRDISSQSVDIVRNMMLRYDMVRWNGSIWEAQKLAWRTEKKKFLEEIIALDLPEEWSDAIKKQCQQYIALRTCLNIELYSIDILKQHFTIIYDDLCVCAQQFDWNVPLEVPLEVILYHKINLQLQTIEKASQLTTLSTPLNQKVQQYSTLFENYQTLKTHFNENLKKYTVKYYESVAPLYTSQQFNTAVFKIMQHALPADCSTIKKQQWQTFALFHQLYDNPTRELQTIWEEFEQLYQKTIQHYDAKKKLLICREDVFETVLKYKIKQQIAKIVKQSNNNLNTFKFIYSEPVIRTQHVIQFRKVFQSTIQRLSEIPNDDVLIQGLIQDHIDSQMGSFANNMCQNYFDKYQNTPYASKYIDNKSYFKKIMLDYQPLEGEYHLTEADRRALFANLLFKSDPLVTLNNMYPTLSFSIDDPYLYHEWFNSVIVWLEQSNTLYDFTTSSETFQKDYLTYHETLLKKMRAYYDKHQTLSGFSQSMRHSTLNEQATVQDIIQSDIKSDKSFMERWGGSSDNLDKPLEDANAFFTTLIHDTTALCSQLDIPYVFNNTWMLTEFSLVVKTLASHLSADNTVLQFLTNHPELLKRIVSYWCVDKNILLSVLHRIDDGKQQHVSEENIVYWVQHLLLNKESIQAPTKHASQEQYTSYKNACTQKNTQLFSTQNNTPQDEPLFTEKNKNLHDIIVLFLQKSNRTETFENYVKQHFNALKNTQCMTVEAPYAIMSGRQSGIFQALQQLKLSSFPKEFISVLQLKMPYAPVILCTSNDYQKWIVEQYAVYLQFLKIIKKIGMTYENFSEDLKIGAFTAYLHDNHLSGVLEKSIKNTLCAQYGCQDIIVMQYIQQHHFSAIKNKNTMVQLVQHYQAVSNHYKNEYAKHFNDNSLTQMPSTAKMIDQSLWKAFEKCPLGTKKRPNILDCLTINGASPLEQLNTIYGLDVKEKEKEAMFKQLQKGASVAKICKTIIQARYPSFNPMIMAITWPDVIKDIEQQCASQQKKIIRYDYHTTIKCLDKIYHHYNEILKKKNITDEHAKKYFLQKAFKNHLASGIPKSFRPTNSASEWSKQCDAYVTHENTKKTNVKLHLHRQRITLDKALVNALDVAYFFNGGQINTLHNWQDLLLTHIMQYEIDPDISLDCQLLSQEVLHLAKGMVEVDGWHEETMASLKDKLYIATIALKCHADNGYNQLPVCRAFLSKWLQHTQNVATQSLPEMRYQIMQAVYKQHDAECIQQLTHSEAARQALPNHVEGAHQVPPLSQQDTQLLVNFAQLHTVAHDNMLNSTQSWLAFWCTHYAYTPVSDDTMKTVWSVFTQQADDNPTDFNVISSPFIPKKSQEHRNSQMLQQVRVQKNASLAPASSVFFQTDAHTTVSAASSDQSEKSNAASIFSGL